MNITYIVHTYGIIKIKGSIHHTIAKLEHYFTIAFSGVFLDFFSAKRVLTLSKTDFSGNFRFNAKSC
jgi:dynactin complex subunit